MSPKTTNELISHRSATSPSMEGVIRQTPLDGEYSQEENDRESPQFAKDMHAPVNVYGRYGSPNNNSAVPPEGHQVQMPQILEQVGSIMEMMKAQSLEMRVSLLSYFLGAFRVQKCKRELVLDFRSSNEKLITWQMLKVSTHALTTNEPLINTYRIVRLRFRG